MQSNSFDITMNLSGQEGINLANISYTGDVPNELIKAESEIERQKTVGEICVPLKEVFYITDMAVIDTQLSGKLIKCN